MKKTILISISLFLLSVTCPAQVITFGPAISANVLWAQINNYDFAVNPIPSYSLGGFARVKLLKFYIQPEVFYARKGVDFMVPNASTGMDDKQQLRYQTVDVNLMLGLQLFKFFHDDIGIRLHTGPGMNHNIDNSFQLNGNKIGDSTISFRPNAFNWQAGIGIDLANRFFLDFRYGVTLSNIVVDGSYSIIPYFGTVQLAYKLIKDK